jgi:hypothetical protein
VASVNILRLPFVYRDNFSANLPIYGDCGSQRYANHWACRRAIELKNIDSHIVFSTKQINYKITL